MDTRHFFHLGRASLRLAAAGALLAGSAVAAVASVHAQTGPPSPTASGPSGIVVARFFGTVSASTGSGSVLNGTTITASVGGVACGVGTVSGNKYTVDVQELAGCITPGAKVNFLVGGRDASPGGSIPSLQGAAVQVDLTISQATPTPSPSPSPAPAATVAATASAARAATSAPPPPPPLPPTRAATASAATRVPTAAPPRATATTPKSTATARSSATAKSAPAAAQKPAAANQTPHVNLPKTGTGGTSDASGGARAAVLALVLLGAAGLVVVGVRSLRRDV